MQNRQAPAAATLIRIHISLPGSANLDGTAYNLSVFPVKDDERQHFLEGLRSQISTAEPAPRQQQQRPVPTAPARPATTPPPPPSAAARDGRTSWWFYLFVLTQVICVLSPFAEFY